VSAEIWKPPTGVTLLTRHKRERLVVLPDGTRCKQTIEGTEGDGYVRHLESDERLDAWAMPKTIRYTFRKG
jgi:hypothetical protein